MKVNEAISTKSDELISKLQQIKFSFYDEVNKIIEEAKDRETNSSNKPDEEFHRGVSVGMTHILILLSKIW